jgi:hypothetical protein
LVSVKDNDETGGEKKPARRREPLDLIDNVIDGVAVGATFLSGALDRVIF